MDKIFGILIIAVSVIFSSVTKIEAVQSDIDDHKITICIDAGHGGGATGYEGDYDGQKIYEKDINLQIALKLRDELLQYENVKVIMTRTDDVEMNIRSRVQYAVDNGADFMVSVHNNNTQNAELASGCMVLTTGSHYQANDARFPDIYGISEEVAGAIAKYLNLLGIPWTKELGAENNGGVARRPYSADGFAKSTLYYPDGSIADYYALLRYSITEGIPAVIIEHTFLCNEYEYRTFLSTEEALTNLAAADVQGIAEALELSKKEQ